MADGNIIVRPAIADGARALADYVAALQAENLRTISRRPPPSEDEERALIAKADANDRALLLVAPEGDKVVGMLDIWAGRTRRLRRCSLGCLRGAELARTWHRPHAD